MAWFDPHLVSDDDEFLERPRCPVCRDETRTCAHLVGQGDTEDMEWYGGLSAIPKVWDLIVEAQEDAYIIAEAFEAEPPWNLIEEDQSPANFLGEHHPKALVCSVAWDGGAPGYSGYVEYVYMTKKAQTQAGRALRRLQGLIDDPPAFAVAARRSRAGDATEDDPPENAISRAASFSLIGQFEQAIACLVEVIGEDSDDVDHWYHLACNCAWADRKWDALFALSQAIYLDSSIREDEALHDDFADLQDDSDFHTILRGEQCDMSRRCIRLDLPTAAETQAAATEARRQEEKQEKQTVEDSWEAELAGMSPDAALDAAIATWDYGMVVAALERGADVNGSGMIPWTKALNAGQGVSRPKYGIAPRWTAAQERWYWNYRRDSDTGVRICRLLVERGADPNIRDGQGRTLLDYMEGEFREELESRGAVHGLGHEIQNAIDAGDEPGLRILLDGVEAGYQLPARKSLLSEAIESGIEICRAVLESVPGAIDRWDFLDCLGTAVRNQDTALAELFLEYGADPLRSHWHEGRKISRLRLAVESNDIDMVSLLMPYAAEGSEARRLLLDAKESGQTEIVEVLESAGIVLATAASIGAPGSLDEELIAAAAAVDGGAMESLIRQGANPDAALPSGESIMQIVVDPLSAGNRERDTQWGVDEPEVLAAVKLLIAHGAVRDKKALEQAAHRVLPSVVALLLEDGDLIDQTERASLLAQAMGSQASFRSYARELESHGHTKTTQEHERKFENLVALLHARPAR